MVTWWTRDPNYIALRNPHLSKHMNNGSYNARKSLRKVCFANYPAVNYVGFRRNLNIKTKELAKQESLAQIVLDDFRIQTLQKQLNCKAKTDEVSLIIMEVFLNCSWKPGSARIITNDAAFQHARRQIRKVYNLVVFVTNFYAEIREEEQERQDIQTAMLELDAFDARKKAAQQIMPI